MDKAVLLCWCLGDVTVMSRCCVGDVSAMLGWCLADAVVFSLSCHVFLMCCTVLQEIVLLLQDMCLLKISQKLREIASRVSTWFPPIKFSYGAQDHCIRRGKSSSKDRKMPRVFAHQTSQIRTPTILYLAMFESNICSWGIFLGLLYYWDTSTLSRPLCWNWNEPPPKNQDHNVS